MMMRSVRNNTARIIRPGSRNLCELAGRMMTESEKERYLRPTELIDSDHPSVRKFAAGTCAGATSDIEKAVRIHNAVRDEVKFGFLSGFYECKASETLAKRRGFCNTKSTLFTAALRSQNIPARIIFVDINTQILQHCISPPTPYVDHSYTEVYLEGSWVKTDSYIVDKPLFDSAKRLLEEDDAVIGYGVHRNGTVEWTGREDAFSQFQCDGSFNNLTTKTFGEYDDALALYSSDAPVWNKKNLFLRIMFPLGVWFGGNSSIENIRRAGVPASKHE